MNVSANAVISDRALFRMLGSSITGDEINIGRAITLHSFQGVLQ